MDKLYLTFDEAMELYQWGNEKFSCEEIISFYKAKNYPIKSLQIEFEVKNFFRFTDDSTSKIIAKCYLKENLQIYLNIDEGNSLGKMCLRLEEDADTLQCFKDTLLFLTENTKQFIVYVFTYVEMLMLYGDKIPYTPSKETLNESSKKTSGHIQKRANKSKPKSKQDGVTYLIKYDREQKPQVLTTGHHLSPSHAFNVRGHFRKYKDGKTIWIEGYEKNGQSRRKKDKIYKLGGKPNDCN